MKTYRLATDGFAGPPNDNWLTSHRIPRRNRQAAADRHGAV